MKIGIVTFYGVANYGAMLQAYALWKYLEKRGHLIEFIDVGNCRSFRLPFYRCLIPRSMKSVKVKFASYIQHHITDFASVYPQTRRFSGFQDLKDNCPKYDALIVGSDQMWNPKWCGPDSIPVVFLGFAPEGCKRISYAASFGVKKWDDEKSAKAVGQFLREFQAISVREESGVKLVEDLSGKGAECLLDPTLLWDEPFYRELMHNGPAQTDRYVFNYILHGWTDGTLEDACLVEVERKTGLKRVLSDSCRPIGSSALMARQFGVEDRVPLSDWLERVARADFVVTNSFHGTVFSILFRRPFATVLFRGEMDGMNERVFTLLESLGLSGRMVNDEHSIIRAIESPINWESVSDRLDALRERTSEFFTRNTL